MTDGDPQSAFRIAVVPTRAMFVRLAMSMEFARGKFLMFIIGILPWLGAGSAFLYLPPDEALSSGPNLRFCIGSTIFAFGILPLVAWTSARRQWRDNPAIGSHREYEFSEIGIRTESEMARGIMKWSLVQKVTVKSGFVLFWMGATQFHFIPLSLFGPEQRSSLDGLLRRNVPGFRGLPRYSAIL